MKMAEEKSPVKELARKITLLRKQLGLSQRELAAKSGVPLTAVRRCEQLGQIPLDRYLAITSALGAKVDVAIQEKPKKTSIRRIKRHMPRAYAMQVAHQIAAQLKAHGAKRVLLFGSLITPRYDADSSDIDIYYEGVPPENIIRAEVDATWETGEEDETGKRRVDLVSGLTRGLKIKKHILSTGVPI